MPIQLLPTFVKYHPPPPRPNFVAVMKTPKGLQYREILRGIFTFKLKMKNMTFFSVFALAVTVRTFKIAKFRHVQAQGRLTQFNLISRLS